MVPDDELTERNVAALHEVAARGGPLVVVTHAGVDLGDLPSQASVDRIDVPRNERELDPILMTVALQLLAYHAAAALGPRHRQAAQPGQVGHGRVTAAGVSVSA